MRSILLLSALFIAAPAAATPATRRPTVTVYKSPTCGCCVKWEDYLRKNGFKVVSKPTKDMAPITAKHGITQELSSCHTAVLGKYVVEGHVPVEAIDKMLARKPAIAGLTAPGMPLGSPGMEGPYPPENYDVIAFDKKGKTSVFHEVRH